MPKWEYDDTGSSWEWEDDDEMLWDKPGFCTPEEAAAPEIPPRYVQVISVKYFPDGSRAVVELLTNELPYLYPLNVGCQRDGSGLWHQAWSSN